MKWTISIKLFIRYCFCPQPWEPPLGLQILLICRDHPNVYCASVVPFRILHFLGLVGTLHTMHPTLCTTQALHTMHHTSCTTHHASWWPGHLVGGGGGGLYCWFGTATMTSRSLCCGLCVTHACIRGEACGITVCMYMHIVRILSASQNKNTSTIRRGRKMKS